MTNYQEICQKYGLSDLSGADLRGANLSGADLRWAKNISQYVDAVTRIVPDGTIIGYKKARNNVIIKLEIPAAAKRSNATGRKCRAEYAIDLGHYAADGRELPDEHVAVSKYDDKFTYRKGDTVHCHQWDDDRWNECSGGIHFFLTFYEAKEY